MPKRRKKKGRLVQLLEFLPVYLTFRLAQMTPVTLGHWGSWLLGSIFYYLASGRRKIALENLRYAFDQTKSEDEIHAIARKSCLSLFVSCFDTVKFIAMLRDSRGRKQIQAAMREFDTLFLRVKEIHEQTGGCIFVTPHLGNWEVLPFVSFNAGIPLVVVVRPLDNRYLENLLYAQRQASGQIIIPKTNSLHFLQSALRRHRSVAMLPDQSTMKAISVDFLGRKATTTPIPAFLALLYNRPIVVVACCRNAKDFSYQGIVSDPIWPERQETEKDEIFRLTEQMNREMGAVVQRFPEQYFWMHDRWKQYTYKKELSLA